MSGYFSIETATMVKTTSKSNLKTDLKILKSRILKEEYATLLSNLVKIGALKFEIVSYKKQNEDGVTYFYRNKRKRVTVKLKDSVVQSEHVCWRMAVLLHELAHVLHF